MPTNNENKYAATSWGEPDTFDFECPSGQLCLMRRADIGALIERGLLTRLDSLTNLVEDKVMPKSPKARAEAEAKQTKAVMQKLGKMDPAEMGNIMKLVNDVVLSSVVQPQLKPVPDIELGEERHEGTIYVDSVSFNDRMAIFGKAMEGLGNLRNFREQSGESVGSLENVAGVPQPTK